ncbi:MAG: AtpZ/AtpI family protein [Deltaproteobacteria bacterium]|nr:AtpZ/AtpI family protein [Deltaproteobacteria bacterium]
MEPEDRRAWKSAMAVASIGLEMGVAIVVGWLGGAWLDDRLGTEPWLMLSGLGLGIAAAFRGLWRTARRHWPRD